MARETLLRAGSPSPRTPPLLFVHDAVQGGLLIVTDARRDCPLSPEQRQAVRQARELLLTTEDVPALAWIGPEGIAAIGRVAAGWINHQAAQHPIVRI
jgi:hypothetical protein